MDKNLFFSFVLPAYKAQFLGQSIESILSQTYKNFELIIVDDASPEDLYSIVSKYNDLRIKYFRNEKNIGGTDLVEQWNHCIEFANGDYTILAADDDLISPYYLSECISLINKYPSIEMIKARTQQIDENNNVTRQDIQLNEYLDFDNFLLAESHILRCIGNYAFKTDILKKQKFINYPLAWWSDLATAFSFMKNGVACTQKIVYSFRVSSIQISNNYKLNILLKKISATKMFFDYLELLLSGYENSIDFIQKENYRFYLKESHMFFKEILKLVRKIKVYDLHKALRIIYKQNIITKKQYYKLHIYYFYKTRKI